MMQPIFRIILIIVSLLTMSFMLRKIRQAKVQIEAAMFRPWLMPAPGFWESIPPPISCSFL